MQLLDPATGKVQAEPLPQRFPVVNVGGANDTPHSAELDRTLVGTLQRPGDVAYVRFAAKAGQEVGVQAVAAAGSKLDPVVQWTDPDGRVLAESTAGLLGVVCPAAGTYTLAIRDRDYRGGPDFRYRLNVGTIPVVTGVVPLGLHRGTERTVHVDGVHLGSNQCHGQSRRRCDAGIEDPGAGDLAARAGARLADRRRRRVSGSDCPAKPLPVPGTADGVIEKPGDVGEWRFTARKGEQLVVEALARRYGSPLDPWVEIVDKDGRPIERAVVRCTAKTVTRPPRPRFELARHPPGGVARFRHGRLRARSTRS